jgi:hypothetical protein
VAKVALARQNILLRRQIGKVAADTGGAFEEASLQEEGMVDIQTIAEDATEETATEEVATGSQSEGDTGDVDGTGDGAYCPTGSRAGPIEFMSNPRDGVRRGCGGFWRLSLLTATVALDHHSSGRPVSMQGVRYDEDLQLGGMLYLPGDSFGQTCTTYGVYPAGERLRGVSVDSC